MTSKKLEIPCGRLNFDPQTKRVIPDKSKGKIELELNNENEVLFKWINLSNGGTVELERYLFVNDAQFEKVYNQKRVYILRFQTDSDLFFFWFQNTDVSRDQDYLKQFNAILNSQFSQEPTSSQIQEETPMSQPQQQQSSRQQQNLDGVLYQQLLDQLNPSLINLNDVLNQEFLKEVCSDEDYLNEILLLLPEEQRDPEYVRENLLSPQFQQAVEQLETALRSQERGGVLASLEVDPSILQQEFDGVMAFLQAIKRKYINN